MLKKIAKIRKKNCVIGPIFFSGKSQQVKKLLNFWDFVNIKVDPAKLDHLGFYYKPSLFW